MQSLSEKAKGKQRADTISEDIFNRGGPVPLRELMVRFTEGIQDLVLHVAEHDLARDVKTKVCPAHHFSPTSTLHVHSYSYTPSNVLL